MVEAKTGPNRILAGLSSNVEGLDLDTGTGIFLSIRPHLKTKTIKPCRKKISDERNQD
jgi:hypothetical protein